MSEKNVELVRRGWAAFLSGDQEEMGKFLDPDVEFHATVGGIQEGEVARGQSGINQTLDEDSEAWEDRRFEAEDFVDAGDDVVVVLIREYRRGKGSGIELEDKTAVVVAVNEGRIVRMQGYMNRDAALEAAGVQGR